jgi:hypothetical protein
MKKIILFLTLFVLVSTCFVTTAMAAPSITDVHGGFGVSATVVNAQGHDWEITLKGPFVVLGSTTVGTITSKSEMIHTAMVPPAFGMGPIKVIIRINRVILPDVFVIGPAMMLGPFVIVLPPLSTMT